MKLRFDANLSPALITSLADVFPDSSHVFDHGDITADDRAIWDLAKRDGFLIATKDTDFLDMSLLHGAPPQVILLRVGNVATVRVSQGLKPNPWKPFCVSSVRRLSTGCNLASVGATPSGLLHPTNRP
jgi:predicted nuclease of predicted toxin-antitoxin system